MTEYEGIQKIKGLSGHLLKENLTPGEVQAALLYMLCLLREEDGRLPVLSVAPGLRPGLGPDIRQGPA